MRKAGDQGDLLRTTYVFRLFCAGVNLLTLNSFVRHVTIVAGAMAFSNAFAMSKAAFE
jgi:hypothetical protein